MSRGIYKISAEGLRSGRIRKKMKHFSGERDKSGRKIAFKSPQLPFIKGGQGGIFTARGYPPGHGELLQDSHLFKIFLGAGMQWHLRHNEGEFSFHDPEIGILLNLSKVVP